MTLTEYKIIQDFLNQSCGIILNDSKQDLVKNRLSTLLPKFNLGAFSDLTTAIQKNTPISPKVKSAIIDAMTTNETFWFRDESQFIELKEKIFPELLKKTKGVRIWSAACSSGQEPYSISICVEEASKKMATPRDVRIIGTDISQSPLLDAQTAIYSDLALSKGLSQQIKEQFFQKGSDGYQLNSNITERVRFQQFNLLKPFSVLGQFDIIFCRNVLIYFSDAVKQDILTRMVNALEEGGYLFLSSTESIPSTIKNIEPIQGKGCVRYFRKSI